MAAPRSIAGRATLALVLMVGFYALALGLAAGLLWIPWAEWHYLGRVHGQVLMFTVGGAIAILVAVAPRADRFEPPGPRLEPAAHPRLFALLRDVADRTGQQMPVEVYLVPEVNAWVTSRGGVLGFGSRRVMGLGLPLMRVLSVSQFRAVVAHEFGHYHGGDVALGPWVHRTRAAIERTLERVSRHSGMLSRPFLWYGRAFVRVTHAVSRQQEYTADALAARVAGARALADGLRMLRARSAAFDEYWRSELAPALNAGIRPPMTEGYAQFLAAPRVAAWMERYTTDALADAAGSPYDTHPPLAVRLAALGPISEDIEPAEEPPAASLLSRVEALELAILRRLAPDEAKPDTLPVVGWDVVGERVWIPFWRRRAAERREGLHGLTPLHFPALATSPAALADRLRLEPPDDGEEAEQARQQHAFFVVECAFATRLHENGWTLNALPGELVAFSRGAIVLHPFDTLARLRGGDLTAEAWAQTCEEAGIGAVELGGGPPELGDRVSGAGARDVA